ncbi:hypothetical protein BDB01DRAFT_796641 [Pilobolus umbonatus]|nr:hypothetical protein BDB01DRAFT_796641 [Pilobolus umbonatus]
MSNNQPNPNRVRGPTSALSSFLREHGIRVNNRSRRARREDTSRNEDTPSSQMSIDETNSESSAMEVESTAQSQPETTSIVYNPFTGRTPKKGTSKKKKKESDSEEEDDLDLPGPSTPRKSTQGRSRISFCSTCKLRFSQPSGENETICPSCKAGTKKQAIIKKKRISPAKKQKMMTDAEVFPSLQDICITVIADYIEDVESLGFISDNSFEKLAKIISRNRKMSNHIARLFMEPFRKELCLYDCTAMDETGFMNVAQFCPKLERLKLIYCGRITDEVLRAYADRLHELRILNLSGAFLITEKTWINFFSVIGLKLESFTLRHSARFNKSCLEALVEHCPKLQHLRLGHLRCLDNDWLECISRLRHLSSLELAWPTTGHVLHTESVVELLSKIGSQLTELSLQGSHELTDEVLVDGIHKYCNQLQRLNIEQCDKLTSDGMVQLFTQWDNRGLTHLDISRCLHFDDKALDAVIHHSGKTLRELNIHSLELLTSPGLEAIAGGDNDKTKCSSLVKLNCGFVRAMDDFVLQKMINKCRLLKDISVWGCCLLTDDIQMRSGVRVVGKETIIR